MADRVISFKGEFDASSILASLKQIRSEMEKGGVDTSLFKGVDKDIAKAEDLITKMMAKIQSGFKDTKEVSAFEKQIGQLEGVFSQIGVGLKNANLPENFKKAAEQIAKMQAHLETSKTELEETRAAAIKFTEAQQASGRYTKAQAEEIKNAVDNEEELLKVVQKVNEEQSKKAQASITRGLTKNTTSGQQAAMTTSITSGYSDESTLALAAAEAGIKRLDTYKKMMAEVIMKGTSLKDAFEELQSEFDDNDKEIMESEEFLKAYTQDLKTLALAAADTGIAAGAKIGKGNISKQANIVDDSGAANISGNFVANTGAYDAQIAKIQQVREETKLTEQEVRNTQQAVQDSVNTSNAQIDTATNTVKESADAWREDAVATKEAAQASENIDKTFGNLQNIVKQVLSLSSAWRLLRNTVQQTYNDIKDLDKSFAQIAMVTSYSVKDMWDSYDNYAQMANELGQSTQSVIQASGLFYQQGLDTAEALSLTEDTMKLATLANLDFQESTSLMTAALRAFHMEMDEGSHITDVYAELAAHAAADVQGIAYAMSKTASIANSAGMAFETTSAFLTQMIETTQEAPENIGTAMKTIIARFTELKENVAGTADSEFDDLDYNKVDKALKSVGVSLKDAQGQFRNLDDVFLELSEKWDTLDRNSQRYIATIAAGSRQQSRFIAMMENYDRTMELIETAQDSAGKSSEQFAKYQDTLEYRVNQLRNSWEQLRTSFLNSDFFKGAIDGVTELVEKLQNIDFKKLLVMTPIILPLAKKFVMTFIKGVQDSASNFSKIGDTIAASVSKSLSKTKIGYKITGELDTKALNAKLKNLKNDIQKETSKINNSTAVEIALNPDFSKWIEEAKASGDATQYLLDKFESLGMSAAEAENVFLALSDDADDFENNILTVGQRLSNMGQESAEATQKLAQIQARSEGVKQGLTAIGQAATTAIAALISGAKAEDVFKTLAASLAVQAAQMALSWATQLAAYKLTQGQMTAEAAAGAAARTSIAGAEGIATGAAIGNGINAGLLSTGIGAIIVGIAAAIAAIGFGIAALYKHWQESNKTIEDQIEEAEANIETLKTEANSAKESAKTSADTAQHIKNVKKEYEELKNKVNKTEEEQQKYNELVNEIRNEWPEIVTYYNETTGELRTQNDLWDSIISKANQAALADQRIAAAGSQALINAEKNKIDLEFNKSQTDLEKKYIFSDENLAIIQDGMADSYAYNDQESYVDAVKNMTKRAEASGDYFGGDLEEAAGVMGLDLDVEEDAKAFLDTIYGYSDEYKDKYDQYFRDLTKQDKEVYERKLELIKEEEKQNQAEFFAAKYGEEDVINQFMADIEIDYNEDEINDKMGEGNKDKRGYVANKLNGGVEGRNKDSSNRAFTGNDFSDWDKADREIKDILKLAGKDKEWYNDRRKDKAGQEEIYQAYLAGLEAQIKEELGDDIYNALSDSEKKAITDFNASSSSMSLTELENSDYEEQFDGENEKAKAKEQVNEAISAWKEALRGAGDSFGVIDFLGGTANDYKDWSTEQLNAYSSALNSIMEEIGEKGAKTYAQSMQKMFDSAEIDPNTQLQLINSIDWTQASALNFDDFKQSSIATIQEITGYNEQEAEEFFDDWSKQAQEASLLQITISDSGQVEEYIAQLKELQATALSQEDTVVEIIAEQEINGEINIDQYDKMVKSLQEMGVEAKDINKYLNVDSDGKITANAEAIRTLYEDQAFATDSVLETQKEQIKADIEKYDKELDILHAQKDQVTATIAEWERINDENDSLVEQVQYYNQIGELRSQITGANFEAIKITGQTKEERQAEIEAIKEETLEEINGLIEVNETKKKNSQEALAAIEKEEEAEKNLNKARRNNFDDELAEKRESLKDATNDLTKAEEDLASAHDKVLDALDDIAEAEQNIIDKTNELNEALYGTENHKNKLDPLYNYTTKLERLQKAADDAKDALDNIQPGDDVNALMDEYLNNSKKETVARKAENQVMQSSISNYKANLDSKLGEEMAKLNEKYGANIDVNMADFYYKDGDRWAVNFEALNAANIPDEISDYVEETVEQMNKLEDNIEKNEEEIKKREKELREIRKKGVQAQVSLENEVAQVLKDKYQEEIDNLKDKYDSMEDADNEYLDALEDAINKQRELRDRQNQWEDLAQKEKKLSLMERDTSGANQVETQKLEKEVQSDREKLLDDSVDQIIDSLKEMYNAQAESREAEIEYQQAVLDNANLIEEANTIIASWESAEDAISFFYENVKGISEMSEAQLEQETESWREMYEAHEVYLATNSQHFEETLQAYEDETIATEQEVQQVINETSEVLTSEAQRSLNEITTKTDESINSAKEALESALDSLTQKKKAYNEALEAEAIALENLKKAQDLFNEAETKRTESEKVTAIEKATEKLTDNFTHDATITDIAKESGYSEDEVIAWLKENYHGVVSPSGQIFIEGTEAYQKAGTSNLDFMVSQGGYRFKEGGLVNYTGPAWVDGTTSKPEAFLDAEDTERIGKAANILAAISDLLNLDIEQGKTDYVNNNSTTNNEDTVINVTVNVENISNDYDVDDAVERVKKDIVDAANYKGANVILRK